MTNAEQIEYWNGDAGKRWAQEDDTMARLLHPVSEALLDHANLEGCQSALDIGCGGGSQSLMLAQNLGPGAQVLGVDISEPMLQVARGKAAKAELSQADLSFLQADAATYDFGTPDFDLVFSRFGVMFFDDPIGAFSNLRKFLRPQARLAFCCWQAMQDNDWTRIPLKAALEHVSPPEEKPDPLAPGPFAFADPQRVQGILQASGFRDIAVEPFTRDIRFGEASTLGASVRQLAMIGPVSRLLIGQDPDVMERVFSAMEDVLAPYYRDGALNLPAAIWFVTAAVD
jgi:ubiquinone/menaquinone biosynthesis C-methylase UbiE